MDHLKWTKIDTSDLTIRHIFGLENQECLTKYSKFCVKRLEHFDGCIFWARRIQAFCHTKNISASSFSIGTELKKLYAEQTKGVDLELLVRFCIPHFNMTAGPSKWYLPKFLTVPNIVWDCPIIQWKIVFSSALSAGNN